MAWSDAARAAALEARRMHAKGRVSIRKVSNDRSHPGTSTTGLFGAHERRVLAEQGRTMAAAHKFALKQSHDRMKASGLWGHTQMQSAANVINTYRNPSAKTRARIIKMAKRT